MFLDLIRKMVCSTSLTGIRRKILKLIISLPARKLPAIFRKKRNDNERRKLPHCKRGKYH
jgi:hypothetical protein